MKMIDIIQTKRDRLTLTKDQIDWFIKGTTDHSIPDYQISALLMAMYLNGMTEQEAIDLTQAMLRSGDLIDLSSLKGFKADKHSTGGVGDKTSLVLIPLVASFGVPMAKMSGRGLGHTGGTIDKLESIPGFRTDLSEDDFFKQVKEIGLAIIGQTKDVAPADKILYGLRDVTMTVDQPALIASSIMSKKLASGADGILLDVKVGSGAFLHTKEQALQLAELMTKIGRASGKKMRAILTNMDEPLGICVGNSLEVEEAIETLQGQGPEDFQKLCVELAVEMLLMAGVFTDETQAKSKVMEKLRNGAAYETFLTWIKAQGATSLEFKKASVMKEVKARTSGYLQKVDATMIGRTAAVLGAGRFTKEDSIDPSAGLRFLKKVGDKIQADELIAVLYTDKVAEIEQAEKIFCSALTIGPEKVGRNIMILGKING